MPPIRPILILGPTAGGKSELAVRLAERLAEHDGLPGQILGADSMQVYRHMEAGTAKPEPALRRQAVHHLIDIVEPTQRFTVAQWLDRADALIGRLLAQGVRPIVVGGTNLYIRALLEGLFEGPPADAALRDRLSRVPAEQLHHQLAAIDPEAARRIAPADRRRITRALEVYHLTQKPISDWQQQWQEPETPAMPSPRASARLAGEPAAQDAAQPAGNLPVYRHDPLLIGLRWPVEAINRRINLRVKAMFYPEKVEPELAASVCTAGQSLPEETRQLEAAGLLGLQAREALGYKQVLAYLAGESTLEEAYERTKVQTRRFARQQRTWLKRFRGVHWFDMQPADSDAPEAPAAAANPSMAADPDRLAQAVIQTLLRSPETGQQATET